MSGSKIIGVLALQGAFAEHIDFLNQALTELNLQNSYEVKQVRTPAQLEICTALVIPGGESTAMSLIAERNEMLEPLKKFTQDESKAVWGTCAGLIFSAKSIQNSSVGQKSLGCLDITVARNAFGAQLHSFTADLDFSDFIPGCTAFPSVFIRAPVVTELGPDVDILYRLKEDKDNLIVAVKQGKKLGTSFHPELTEDVSIHKYFISEFVN